MNKIEKYIGEEITVYQPRDYMTIVQRLRDSINALSSAIDLEGNKDQIKEMKMAKKKIEMILSKEEKLYGNMPRGRI